MITRVELVNFKSHPSPGNVFTFTAGANAVLGPTGAGKTSILQAIGICIFDFGQPGRYLRNGAKKGEAIVTFRSPIDQQEYTIKRQLGGSKFHLLDQRATILAETKDEALRTVRAKLGLEENADLRRLFEELIGTPQGKITGALAQSEKPRIDIFNRILRIEEYREAYAALARTESHGRDQIQAVTTKVAGLEARLEGASGRAIDFAKVTGDITNAEQTLNQANETQTKADQDLEAIRAAKKIADDAREKLTVVANNVAGQRQAKKDLERRVEDAKKAQDWLDENKDDLTKGNTAEKYLDDHEADYQENQKATQSIEDAKRNLQRTRDSIEKQDVRRAAKAKELEGAPDFKALDRKHTSLTKVHDAAEAAHTKASQSFEEAKAKLLDLARTKKTWDTLERIRTDASAVPKAFRNGNHRTKFEEGKLRIRDLETLHESLDGQFKLLAAKTCPILDLGCPVPNPNIMKAREDRKKDLMSQVRDAKAGLVLLEQNAGREETSAQQIQAWGDRAAEYDEVTSRLRELQKLKEALPTLEKHATERKKEVSDPKEGVRSCEKDLNKKIHFDNLRDAIKEIDHDIKESQAEATGLETTITTNEATVKRLAPTAKNYEAHRETRKRLVSLLAQSQGRITLAAEKTQRSKDLSEGVEVLARMEAEESRQRKDVADLWTAEHQRRLGAAEKADKEAHGAVSTAKETLKNLRQRRTELKAQVDQDKGNQGLLDAQRAEHSQMVATQAHLETVRNILNDAGPIIAKRFVASISIVANQKYQELTGGQPVRLRWTETYDVEITDMDGETKPFEDLSGGEQVMAALAIRLALLSETSSLSFAFFDEPTIHLDEDSRNHVADVLNRTGFEQLVVVSHDDSFSEKIHHAVRLKKNGTRTQQDRPLTSPEGTA